MTDLRTSITEAFRYLDSNGVPVPIDLIRRAQAQGINPIKGGEGSGNFGHGGRPGEIGGSSSSGGSTSGGGGGDGGGDSGEGGSDSGGDRQKTLSRIASENNITSKVVYAQTPQDTKYGRDNNVPSNAGAVCDEQTGTIYVFDKAFESGAPIAGIVAHEEMHNTIYNSKYGQKDKLNFINKNSNYSQDDFIKSADFTSYTKYNWAAWALDEIPFMRAVNETLCEIARTKSDNPKTSFPPMWEELYNNVKG